MIDKLLRKNILNLQPYSSARDEFSGAASIFLDANESPFPHRFNRYPDPHQRVLKAAMSKEKNIPTNQIIFGNGSDEIIDLLIRSFCEPGRDSLIICPPTYGMYAVSANINEVAINEVSLLSDYQLDVPAILKAADVRTKLLFICSPNNPTGNLMNREDIITLLQNFDGMVVVDEAYSDFAPGKSLLSLLSDFENLFIMQTFSKARGLAGIRLGMGFGHPYLISVLNKVKPPYNVNAFSQQRALKALDKPEILKKNIRAITRERNRMAQKLHRLSKVEKVFPSDANFLLVRFRHDAVSIYQKLIHEGIIVRDRSRVHLCEGSLRLSIGTRRENDLLFESLKKIAGLPD